MSAGAGRYAPSPTGELHLGNLRTALLAWLFARAAGAPFLVRVEDLDTGRVRERFVAEQLDDLSAIGLDWDGEVVRQSERGELYRAALASLTEAGLTYRCFCSRREIREAASAHHGEAEGAYPGTCREVGTAEARRRADAGEPFAIRLRAEGAEVRFVDRLHGERSDVVDDLVLRRRDGAFAYNLAVVVDDAAQGIGDGRPRRRPARVDRRPGARRRPARAAAPGVGARPARPRPGRLAAREARRRRHPARPRRARPRIPPTRSPGWPLRSAWPEPGERPDARTLLSRFDPEALPREPTVFNETLIRPSGEQD